MMYNANLDTRAYNMVGKHKWLSWAIELQSIAQNGLTFSKDSFDLQRFKRLQDISAEIMSYQSFEDFEKIRNLLATEQHYLTPKIDVRVSIIQDNNKILLVKEVSDGKWTLPGGWADVNESPSECAIKEVFEETGYKVKLTKLYAFIDKQKRCYPPQIPHAYKCFFLAEIVDGKPTPSIETSEIRFFHKDELPELSLNRVMPEQIELAFKHYSQHELPTEFD